MPFRDTSSSRALSKTGTGITAGPEEKLKILFTSFSDSWIREKIKVPQQCVHVELTERLPPNKSPCFTMKKDESCPPSFRVFRVFSGFNSPNYSPNYGIHGRHGRRKDRPHR